MGQGCKYLVQRISLVCREGCSGTDAVVSGAVMKLGEKVGRLITRDHWQSLRAVARRAGVSHASVSRAARGDGSLGIRSGLAVARALGVPAEWLYDDARDWPPPAAVEAPPIAIVPWPPHGITWGEVKLAIAGYMLRRAMRDLSDGGADAADLERQADLAGRLGEYAAGEATAADLLDLAQRRAAARCGGKARESQPVANRKQRK